MKLAGAMIFVADLQAMTAFYRDTLNLKLVEETRLDDWVEFDTGQARFSLHQIPSAILENLPSPSGKPREQGPTKLTFRLPSVADEVARLRGLGVAIIERPWGAFELVDPEGNVSGLSEG
jgi:catechol 2,3-dioxygenase-like lactoylglutathione lyase family enzyme